MRRLEIFALWAALVAEKISATADGDSEESYDGGEHGESGGVHVCSRDGGEVIGPNRGVAEGVVRGGASGGSGSPGSEPGKKGETENEGEEGDVIEGLHREIAYTKRNEFRIRCDGQRGAERELRMCSFC